MKRKIQLFCMSQCVALLATCGFADSTTKVTENGQYVITVPANTLYTMTSSDVTALGSNDLVKKGEGRLHISSVVSLKDYAGKIYINEGTYSSEVQYGLGSESATTYVDGGTFSSRFYQGGGVANYPGTLHLKGTGFNNTGALSNWRAQPHNSGFNNVTLDGDALIVFAEDVFDSVNSFAIRQTLDMGNYTLTIRGAGKRSGNDGSPTGSVFAVTYFKNMGNLVVDNATISFLSAFTNKEGTTSLTLTNKGALNYDNAGVGISDQSTVGNVKLILEDGAAIYCKTATGRSIKDNYIHNYYAGPVEVTGCTTISLMSDATQSSHIQFAGKITGEGGFAVTNGAKIVFCGKENDFKGDIIVNGVDVTPGTTVNSVNSGAVGGEVCGVLGSIIGVTEGSIPTNKNQRIILNKGYVNFNQSNLPEVVCGSESMTVIYPDANTTYNLPKLTGFTAITNGFGTLTGTWTLRTEDLVSAYMLSNMNSTATLSFAEGSSIALEDESSLELEERQLTYGEFEGLENVKTSFKSTTGKYDLRIKDNNLWLIKKQGLMILVR